MDSQFEIIVSIVNNGFSDRVMESARALGAGGGTIFKARGTANTEAEKIFGISIEPEKEVVIIIVKKEKVEPILHALYQNAGLNTEGNGIAFTLPIEEIVGLPDKQK